MIKHDRLEDIKSCIDGLKRGESEPLFLGDLEWLVNRVEHLQGSRDPDLSFDCTCGGWQIEPHDEHCPSFGNIHKMQVEIARLRSQITEKDWIAVDPEVAATDKREQVARQCAAVALLCRNLGSVRKDYVHLVRSGCVDQLLDLIGSDTAREMNILGDMLNGMDAVDPSDAWTEPVFEEARRLWQSSGK